MTRYKKHISFGVAGLLLFAATSAYSQVASLGKGWLLDRGGSITSAPGEVISGRNSVKASGTSPVGGQVTPFLGTDPTFVRFLPNQSYTMAFSYRIITADGGGFGYGFESSEGIGVGDFGTSSVLRGAPGSSGTVSTTFRLNNHGDFRFFFAIDGRGSIVIDDIRITDSNGQLVASENAEGPSLAPGPLNFQVTDAIALLTPAQASGRTAAAKDLDGDGYPETILTLSAPRPSTTPLEPIVIEASGRMRVATGDFFPAGAPTVKHSAMTIFTDINNDGLTDILFADAGSDAEPFPGSPIGVALNVGGGKYRDVSSLIPADQHTTRSYAIEVGDLFGDGRVEIILPDQSRGTNTALLRWNGNGFDEIRDWIPQSIWSNGPAVLKDQSWMSLADFDRDGRLDLLVTGQMHNPNFQIVFGGPGGFTTGTLVVLPDGPFGHKGGPQPDGTLTTLEVTPAVVADFNNDGLPDIFATFANVTLFTTGCPTPNPCRFDVGDMTYAVRLNQGARRFIDASPSPYVSLGRIAYQDLMTVDINHDGFVDVVGRYVTNPPLGTSPQWGTTLFLNDGTGFFQVVDGAQFIGATTTPPNGNRWGLGSFVPTVISPGRTEGIVYQSVGGCGTPGGCPATGLNFFKVVANGSLGTGPNFVDPATLGVPGFNEFYYLRHHSDAADAVRSGQYATGLAHYLAVGKRAGYNISAPNAKSGGFPFSLVDRGSISRTGTETSSLITTGYARVQADQGSTTPAGVAIYGYRPGNYLVSETAVLATLPARSGRIYAEVSTSVTTGLAIANPNDQPATIDFYYTDAAGADTGTGRITLGPKSQFANFIDQAPLKRFSASTFEGTFSYASDVPVSAMAIRGVYNERGDFLMSTLPVIDLSSPPQTGVVVVPHFADGGGWTTQILLVNPGNSAANGKVEFRDPNGALTSVPLSNQATGDYLIPPRSSRKLATTGAGATTTGSVRIIPTGGSAAPIALIVFSYKPAGVVLSQAGVMSVRGTALRMYAASAAIPFRLQTGLALANIGSAETTVTFELFNHDGSTTGLPLPSSRTLAAFGQTAMFLSDIFSGTLPDPFSGVLRISTSSSDGISAVGLRSLYNEQGDFLITTTPPTDEAPPTDASERIFPHLAFGGGYSTEFVLFSGKYGQSSTGTVWLLSNSGVPLYVPLR